MNTYNTHNLHALSQIKMCIGIYYTKIHTVINISSVLELEIFVTLRTCFVTMVLWRHMACYIMSNTSWGLLNRRRWWCFFGFLNKNDNLSLHMHTIAVFTAASQIMVNRPLSPHVYVNSMTFWPHRLIIRYIWVA